MTATMTRNAQATKRLQARIDLVYKQRRATQVELARKAARKQAAKYAADEATMGRLLPHFYEHPEWETYGIATCQALFGNAVAEKVERMLEGASEYVCGPWEGASWYDETGTLEEAAGSGPAFRDPWGNVWSISPSGTPRFVNDRNGDPCRDIDPTDMSGYIVLDRIFRTQVAAD